MKDTLKAQLKHCRLSGIYDNYDRILQESEEQQWNHEQFFTALLDEEIIKRENSRYQRLIRQAGLPTLKTIAQFDFSKAPFLDKKEILQLHDCNFILPNTNIIFLGAPGTGKSHLATSIANEACKRGKTVAFYTAASLGNRLVEMQEERQLVKFLGKLKKKNKREKAKRVFWQ